MNDTPEAAPSEATALDTPPADTPSADTPPDRLSTDPRSDHYDGDALARGVGIRFKGVERTNVEEYSVSGGWVRMAVSQSRDRRGMPMTVKLAGPVEAYYRDFDQAAPEQGD